MNKRKIQEVEKILKKNLIKAGIRCAFVCEHGGKVLVTVNMQDSVSKAIGDSVSSVADDILAVIKSASDQLARLIGDKAGLSLFLHKENEESVLLNELTDNLLLGTISGNEVALGALRLRITETIEMLRGILPVTETTLVGQTVEVLVKKIFERYGKPYAEGKTEKMQDVRLLLPDDHEVEVGDLILGKIVEARPSYSVGLMTGP